MCVTFAYLEFTNDRDANMTDDFTEEELSKITIRGMNPYIVKLIKVFH
jgi:hypothetical protein